MPKQFGTPGPRALYPSAATSSSLAACDPMAQLLFDRLISAADDQGRQLGDLTLVKAACMPLIRVATLNAIARWLGELERHDMIIRYTAGGLPLIQLRRWWTYQQQRHIWPSRWSPPRGWDHDQIKGHGAAAEQPRNRHPADDGPHLGPPPAPEKRPNGGPEADDGGPLPRTRGAGPGHAGPGHAGAVGRDAADTDRAPPSAPTNGARLTGNAYASFEVLTGKPPSDKTMTWLDDECGRYGREHVVKVMYATPEPAARGWMNRVKDRLRQRAADDEPDWGTGEEPATPRQPEEPAHA